ncbi:hypothetical protein BJY01DRAFT_253321 [Aspergillus pseudoustus]|uniref:GST C-terminal domain-containing protein n=1 Tax=Aspergillus pseudoustus TaxID=1810923 RepID=A0ABR4J1P2_9EURO
MSSSPSSNSPSDTTEPTLLLAPPSIDTEEALAVANTSNAEEASSDTDSSDEAERHHFVLYCRAKHPVAASAALIMECLDALYRVDIEEEGGVDTPALWDPDTEAIINNRDICPYLLKKLDVTRAFAYEEDSGDIWGFLYDMEFYFQKFKCTRIVGIRTSLADFVFFPLAFEMYATHLSRAGEVCQKTGEWYNLMALVPSTRIAMENYTVSFDEEDMNVDNPSLYDPSTDSTVSGAEMLTYLMERLDQRRDHSFAQDTEEANQVQRRYRNLCSRIQAGNPLAVFMDLYWLLQDREEPVVIGDRATILDIAYFALFFPISMRVWNAGNFGHSAVRRWYNYIASHREVLDGLYAVGWTTASEAFQDLADRHSPEQEVGNS